MKRIYSQHINQKTLMILVLAFLTILQLSCKNDEDPLPEDTSMVYHTADNTNIQYLGRIDFSNAKKPSFSFPGVSIKAKFQGKAIDAVIKDYGLGGTQATNYFHVLIDGSLKKVLEVNKTDTLYQIADDLSDGDHTIELIKRTEASVGKSSFLGFRLRKDKNLLPLPAASSRKIEFIGDSFTAGYGNEVSIPNPGGNPNVGFHSVNENNYSAWGNITARSLDAQYHCTAYSGRGLYRNNTGSTTGTIPSIYNHIHPDNSSPAWNTSNYIPDVVVIMLGINDFFPEQWGTPSMVDSTQFVNTYISFAASLRTNYPNAQIICVVPNGLSNYWPAGFNSLTRIKNYIDATVDTRISAGDNKIYYFELTTQTSPYGEDWHPSNATHTSMANQIIPFIKSKTGW